MRNYALITNVKYNNHNLLRSRNGRRRFQTQINVRQGKHQKLTLRRNIVFTASVAKFNCQAFVLRKDGLKMSCHCDLPDFMGWRIMK